MIRQNIAHLGTKSLVTRKSCYTLGMDFLTIHELSVEFDIPARVLRYRFHQLRQEAKLADGVDYRRDDFVDDRHFFWKINPVSFMRETGLKPVTKSATLVNETDNQKPLVVTTAVSFRIQEHLARLLGAAP